MGNSKSTLQLSNNFDKDTEFNENDDGGFLEAKLKSAEASVSRGQAGRRSFHYVRLRENQDLALPSSTSGKSDKLKRVYSLPPPRIKKKAGSLGKKDTSAKPNHKISVQGFDLFRHHLGQMNCDVSLFQSLESEILALNEKLLDIERTRKSCLDKLHELRKDLAQNQSTVPCADRKVAAKKSNASDLALSIIEKYIERLDGLLKVDNEPFLLDAHSGGLKQVVASVEKSLSSQPKQSHSDTAKTETPRGKRQQIKDAYNQLIRSVMPKLFGKQFAHKSDAHYCSLRQNLGELREQVHSIATSDEQKLIDAKRIFMQEIDGYLRTLDEMVTCTDKCCTRCTN